MKQIKEFAACAHNQHFPKTCSLQIKISQRRIYIIILLFIIYDISQLTVCHLDLYTRMRNAIQWNQTTEDERVRDLELISHIGFFLQVIPLKLFLNMVPSSSVDNVTTHVSIDVFMENENESKATWAVHVNKISVTGLAVSRPS